MIINATQTSNDQKPEKEVKKNENKNASSQIPRCGEPTTMSCPGQKSSEVLFVKLYQPPLSYLVRKRQVELEQEHKKFMDQMKALSINMPFIDAIAQMPKYIKFLKDLLINQKKLKQASEVILNEQCSTMVTNMNNMNSVIIPCKFGNSMKTNILVDSGASMNLMPY